MSRPRKQTPVSPDGTEKKPRKKRIDPTPYRCYFKHFVAQLSLGAILNGKDVVKVFMCDSATHNYSDVTEIDALKAACKKMFRSRKEQTSLVAQFRSGTDASNFLEPFMNLRSEDTITETELTTEVLTAQS